MWRVDMNPTNSKINRNRTIENLHKGRVNLNATKKAAKTMANGESGGTGETGRQLDTSQELDPAAMIGANRAMSKSRSFLGGQSSKLAKTTSMAKIRQYEKALKKPEIAHQKSIQTFNQTSFSFVEPRVKELQKHSKQLEKERAAIKSRYGIKSRHNLSK